MVNKFNDPCLVLPLQMNFFRLLKNILHLLIYSATVEDINLLIYLPDSTEIYKSSKERCLKDFIKEIKHQPIIQQSE